VSLLRLVSFGPPATGALQEAISAAKGSDPLQPVTVAVPSNYAGLSLRRRLGASQGGPVNVGFIVFSRVAELLGSPALASAGKRPLTSPVRAEAVRGALAPKASLLSIAPTALVLSALRADDDGQGIIVRLYNIASQPTSGEMRLEEPYDHVDVVNLNEQPLGPAKVEDGTVRLSLKPNEIVTLRFHTSR